jgi:cyclic 2,3-diphosphoglycerate synthase
VRVIALIDGEHYPPVTRWGIDTARTLGYEVLAGLLVGGAEKLGADRSMDVGVRTIRPADGEPAGAALEAALAELRPEAVLDLSDEPIVGYRERMEFASISLAHGVPYVGSDFRLDPPISGPPLPAPTLAVIGTGKRTGKTAICGAAARVAASRGLAPVIVAMGRGGPPEPEVAQAGSVTLERLLSLVRDGRHAASDYLEDAAVAGVTTIGARRAGGGLAGAPFASNVRAAAQLALRSHPGLVLLEGSGASVPPMPWDAGILVVPASAPPEYLGGYLGPLRLLLSDLVVFTMAGSPTEGLTNLPALKSHVQRIRGDARIVVTDFRPVPMGEVRGRDVFFTTTAPDDAAARQVAHLEAAHGCRVVGWSARLADRAGLVRDMEGARTYDVLLTELKAAAIDVASRRATARGAEVVFVENRAEIVEGDADVSAVLAETVDLALERSRNR